MTLPNGGTCLAQSKGTRPFFKAQLAHAHANGTAGNKHNIKAGQTQPRQRFNDSHQPPEGKLNAIMGYHLGSHFDHKAVAFG